MHMKCPTMCITHTERTYCMIAYETGITEKKGKYHGNKRKKNKTAINNTSS